jgi:AP-1 complex subunit mu
MTYRLSTQVKPLIWVEAQIERHSRSRVEFTIKARSQFKERRYLEIRHIFLVPQ